MINKGELLAELLNNEAKYMNLELRQITENAMEQYAIKYHESKVKKLNLHSVIKSVCSLCKKEIEINRESNIFCDECWKTL